MLKKIQKVDPDFPKKRTQFIEGKLYVQYTCGCVFLDTEDRKRKKRTMQIKTETKKTNVIFCPYHLEHRFKIRFKVCPECKETIYFKNSTKKGPCYTCSVNKKNNKKETKKINKNKLIVFQYDQQLENVKLSDIETEVFCANRLFCLSMFDNYQNIKGQIQCKNCPHKKPERII